MVNLNDKKGYLMVVAAVGIALFSVAFAWRFWSVGVDALGVNFVLLWMGIIWFFLWSTGRKLRSEAVWLVPVSVIALSVGIYSNSFTGWISVLILPLIFFVFTTHAMHVDYRQTLWSKWFAPAVVRALFGYLRKLLTVGRTSIDSNSTQVVNKLKSNNVASQIALGVIGLFIVSFFVIVPLLSGADAAFEKIFDDIMASIADIISLEGFAQIATAIVTAAVLVALVRYWYSDLRPFGQSQIAQKNDNSIAIGIILSGVLALYILFIAIQIKTLFVGELPIDFGKTEYLVKTGFWQLFWLTATNIIFFAVTYRTGAPIVRRILTAFTMASLLLVVSAGHRMWLYVTGYGLSYEKFFAFYTVVFCVGVFIWFLWLLARRQTSAPIVRNLAFAALWLYALAAILPLERIIFSTNLYLTQQENSRVNINELRMLGYDALPLVERNWDTLIREAKKDNFQSNSPEYSFIESFNHDKQKESDLVTEGKWKRWVQKQIFQRDYFNIFYYVAVSSFDKDDFAQNLQKGRKAWYEKSLIELFVKPQTKVLPWQEIVDIPTSYGDVEIFTQINNGKITWRNPVSGFAFEFDADLRLDSAGLRYYAYKNYLYDEGGVDKVLEDIRDDDYSIVIVDDQSDVGELQIWFFDKKAKELTQLHKENKELFDRAASENWSKIVLPSMPEVLAFRFRTGGNKFARYGIIAKLPTGIMRISTNKLIKKSDNSPTSDEQYIQKMSKNSNFAQIINSIKIIPVQKYNKR